MFRREDTKKKERLRGMDKLMAQGGFIREAIEEELEEVFQVSVIDIAQKYCENGIGIWEVAQEIERAKGEILPPMPKPGGLGAFLQEEQKKGEFEQKFREWYIEQNARLAAERYRTKAERFWVSWDLDREVKRIMATLTLIEERVLFLTYGPDGTPSKRTAAEIAALPEFACSKRYIERIIERIEIRGVEMLGRACGLFPCVREKERGGKEHV